MSAGARVAALVIAAAACRSKSAATAPHDGANQVSNSPDAAIDASDTAPDPIAALRDALSPIASMPPGLARARRACEAEPRLSELADAVLDVPAPAGVDGDTWTKATEDVRTGVLTVEQICTGDGGGPAQAAGPIQDGLDAAQRHLTRLLALIPR